MISSVRCVKSYQYSLIATCHVVGRAHIHVDKVIPDDTRDRAEALLLLARATIEKGGASGESLGGADYHSRAGISSSEALEMGTAHLKTAIQVKSLRSPTRKTEGSDRLEKRRKGGLEEKYDEK